MLIAGHFVGGPCDHSTGKLVVRSPYDDSVVGTAAEGAWLEANAALDAACEAFGAWRETPLDVRSALLANVAQAIRDRADELAELLVAEIGKPIVWARGEVARCALTFELASHACLELGPKAADLGGDPRAAQFKALVQRFPVGPVLGIVPYNWPLNLAAHKIAPALAAGCPIVVKPSSQAPLSTLSLVRLVHEAGCPAGVIGAVVCPSQIAERMALDDRIAKVSFTGSPRVGWTLKDKLPRKRVTLELGGDASAIVMPDADLEWAVERIVWGKFGYAGQICISVQHARVHRAVYEAFRERLVASTRAVRWGDPSDPSVVCGPIISDEAADRVESWMDEAVSMGAHALVREPREGRIVKPALLEHVPPEAQLGCGEVFGPVLTLSAFDDLDEAIEQINASKYGIHAGVFTGDLAIADLAFRRLDVGGVVIGDVPTVRFDNLPYGGVKESGFGREGVQYAIEEMTEIRSRVDRTSF